MKIRLKLIALLFLTVATAWAQPKAEDPVLMTIAGKPVTKGEFEYSYFKNAGIAGAVEKKTVAEYAQMFLNYKLKVAAAEQARLDTLSSFKAEFAQYRNIQLMPNLVDTMFIDSVARAVYRRTAVQLDGKDMLRLAHILIMVPPSAPDADDRAARAKADSINNAIAAGADFAEMAKKFSQDPGSSRNGGELPWIGPGMTIPEFEKAAYTLQRPGQVTGPVHTAVGYHIIKLLERKSLEPYAKLEQQIKASLKQQGIEEAAAEAHIKKLIAAGHGRLTRASIMDSLLQARENADPNLHYLVREYHDGLLLYEISKRTVWDVAANDSVALERLFAANKKKYAWKEPHFKGFVIQAKNAKALKAATKVLKKNADANWRQAIKQTVNKDSVVVSVSGPYLVKKGENANIDKLAFGAETAKTGHNQAFPYVGLCGKKLSKPKNYTDVKAAVVADLQKQMEDEWVSRLRKTIPYNINEAVLATIKER